MDVMYTPSESTFLQNMSPMKPWHCWLVRRSHVKSIGLPLAAKGFMFMVLAKMTIEHTNPNQQIQDGTTKISEVCFPTYSKWNAKLGANRNILTKADLNHIEKHDAKARKALQLRSNSHKNSVLCFALLNSMKEKTNPQLPFKKNYSTPFQILSLLREPSLTPTWWSNLDAVVVESLTWLNTQFCSKSERATTQKCEGQRIDCCQRTSYNKAGKVNRNGTSYCVQSQASCICVV